MCVGIMIVRFIIMAANEIISKFTFQLSVGSAGERERVIAIVAIVHRQVVNCCAKCFVLRSDAVDLQDYLSIVKPRDLS